MVKVTGALQKSTEIMKLSNALIKLPQISQAMREMSMEMTKACRPRHTSCAYQTHILQAGIMEEMLDDTLQMEDDEDLEVEADAEVDKVLYELTEGKLGQAGAAKEDVPVSASLQGYLAYAYSSHSQSIQDQVEDEETERAMEQYRQQLNGLLSG